MACYRASLAYFAPVVTPLQPKHPPTTHPHARPTWKVLMRNIQHTSATTPRRLNLLPPLLLPGSALAGLLLLLLVRPSPPYCCCCCCCAACACRSRGSDGAATLCCREEGWVCSTWGPLLCVGPWGDDSSSCSPGVPPTPDAYTHNVPETHQHTGTYRGGGEQVFVVTAAAAAAW